MKKNDYETVYEPLVVSFCGLGCRCKVRSGYHCLTWPESCKLRPVASELSIPSCLTTPSNVTLLLLEVRTPQRS